MNAEARKILFRMTKRGLLTALRANAKDMSKGEIDAAVVALKKLQTLIEKTEQSEEKEAQEIARIYPYEGVR